MTYGAVFSERERFATKTLRRIPFDHSRSTTTTNLYGGFDLREEVDELDVGGEQQGARGDAAQVELRVEQIELDERRRAAVAGDEITEFTEYVTADFHHVLVASRCLEVLCSYISVYVRACMHVCVSVCVYVRVCMCV